MFDMNSDSLRKFLQMLGGNGSDEDYEPIATLSPEQKKEWDEIQDLHERAKSMDAEAHARSSLFWVHLERRVKEAGMDPEGLKIDGDVVYRKVEQERDVPDDLPSLEG